MAKAKKKTAAAVAPVISVLPGARPLDPLLLKAVPPPWKLRDLQSRVLQRAWDALSNPENEYVVLEAPPGCGKTLVAITLARVFGPTAILTSTVQLQEQYLADFESSGLKVLKGRKNFRCSRAHDTCEVGARLNLGCTDGEDGTICPYRIAKEEALEAPILNANYHSFWRHMGKAKGGEDSEDGDIASHRKLLVVDECFPAGTMVSGHPIEAIKEGWVIPSFDEVRRVLVPKRVTRTFKRRPTELVQIILTTGVKIVCTPEHPFLTSSGWVSAFALEGKTVLDTEWNAHLRKEDHGPDLSRVQGEVHCSGNSTDQLSGGGQERSEQLLLQKVPPASDRNNPEVCRVPKEDEGYRATPFQSSALPKNVLLLAVSEGSDGALHHVPGACPRALRTHEEVEPDVRPNYQGARNDDAQAPWKLEASSARWERYGANSPRDAVGGDARVVNYGNRVDGSARSGLPDALQVGRSRAYVEGSNRGGREQPLLPQGARPKEGNVLAWTRVDRVEVLKPGSDTTFGGMCPDGHVYNLEVEGTHTYCVNGVVVHNCHRVEDTVMSMAEIVVRLSDIPVTMPKLPTSPSDPAPYYQWLDEAVKPLEALAGQLHKEGNLEDEDKVGELLHRIELVRYTRLKQAVMAEDTRTEYILERGVMPDGRLDENWFSLKPLHVRHIANRIWAGFPKVLFMSATILNAFEFCTALGLDPAKGEFVGVDESFPPENRPINLGQLDMSYGARDESWPLMVNIIANLMRFHDTQKGLVLCSSNVMMKYIMKELGRQDRALQGRLIPAFGEDRLEKYHEHLRAKGPTVLIASGYWEGADLKDDASRFAIIPSLPRAMFSGQVKARAQLEPRWYRWSTLTKTLQGIGRSVRSETDEAVTYILDREFTIELGKKDSMIPGWVRAAVVQKKEGQ